ncbi:deoxyhypusine synthase [Saprolegnia diclina VS20]|uniref:deoxyhypusine synthase n=1 Tax=Saprolegnia diclina (strain VS20) TaxID=1156394 RepID=T0QIF0_SAPDV|nr:deoxyhypusine synthase [Saprolegnia diclina VS20]EQC34491.1 deoxyhypusine synthase [Saprolegnia diclina VS20]|eukprot:XP_008611897.1 deoxyhypusine synthase [Saprolegnia diclina VS20]
MEAKQESTTVPAGAQAAVLVKSERLDNGDYSQVKGYDFNQGVDYAKLMESYRYMGFQATNLGKAVEEINRMRSWRLSDEPIDENDDDALKDPTVRANFKCKIFLGYTSNLISSGLRETLRFLAQHKMVDVIVATAGGIEEDFIKCLAPTYIGDFALKGADLRTRGINRIGNLLVPNDNYCKFEDWLNPILDTMLEEQKTLGTVWSPSTMIHRLGKEINNEDSVYYWCYKNNIPVFCPALTDGSIGDMIYFHSYRNEGLVLDIVSDIRRMNDHAIRAKKTGVVILGGGVVKHHILNANLMRNGADFGVFVNTGQEYDGSDAGARPDEAISWGKLRLNANPVKVYAEATLVFPLLVAETFAKDFAPTSK